MIWFELPRDLAPWPPASAVVVAVRHNDTVVVADRRTVTGPRVDDRAGTAPVGDDSPRLGVTAGGCTWAIAGHAVVGGLDFRDTIAANTETNPALAARHLRHLFDEHASTVRAAMWEETGFPTPETLDPVHLAVVIAGQFRDTVETHVVGLAVRGGASWLVLNEGAVKVLAPPPLGTELPDALQPAVDAESPDDAIDLITAAIRTSATTMDDLISSDLDTAIVRPTRVDVGTRTTAEV